MKVGSIVFIGEEYSCPVNTGIVTKIEFDTSTGENWFEVFCDDGYNHVIPGHLLSSAYPQKYVPDGIIETSRKIYNLQQHSSKHTKNKLHYIHNGKQKLK